jgi:hypothetical protein
MEPEIQLSADQVHKPQIRHDSIHSFAKSSEYKY